MVVCFPVFGKVSCTQQPLLLNGAAHSAGDSDESCATKDRAHEGFSANSTWNENPMKPSLSSCVVRSRIWAFGHKSMLV